VTDRTDLTLLNELTRLADDCARDDARALSAPWAWTDETLLWNAEADHCVLQHGGTHWPMTAENREVIAAARNRLPDLVRSLREAAKRLDSLEKLRRDHTHLQRQYAESRDYVATLVHEVSDLKTSAQRHVNEAHQADARIDALEAALAEALMIAEWEASEYQGKSEHLTRLPELRAILTRKAQQATRVALCRQFIADMALTARQTAVPDDARLQMLHEIHAAARDLVLPDWYPIKEEAR
jgi:hypothetical protein